MSTHPCTLRPATPEDEGALYRIYASTREEELAAVPWSAEEKESFLTWQASLQHRYYRENYPGAEFQVIQQEGQTIGRLYLHRRPDEIRIMDIALLPEYRNRGYGTALLSEIMAEGQRSHRRVSIHVESFNRALRLYQRLGFSQKTENGVYLLMEWSPSVGPTNER